MMTTRNQILIAGALLLAMTGSGLANVLTIRGFNELRPSWNKLAKDKTRLVIEGRYSGRAGTAMRLQKCDALLHPAKGKKLPIVTDRKKNIELSGYLKSRGGRYLFIVERHSVRKSDLQRAIEIRSAIRGGKPEAWYKLGQSAIEKAKFYEDQQLKTEGVSILTEGVHREQKSLKKDDINGIRKLAERVAKFDLDKSLQMELLHEALWAQWRLEKKDPKQNLDELIKLVITDLPGADKPRPRDAVKASVYLQSPKTTYRKTAPKNRIDLHRIFCATIQLEKITRQATADGQNGYEIAMLIEESVPEFTKLPTEYRRRELSWQSSRLGRLNKSQMHQLSKRYHDIGDEADARRTITDWLDSLEKQLRPQGPVGLIKLADLYRTELNDRPRELDLLKEAWARLADGSAEEKKTVETRMNANSYYLINGVWTQSDKPVRGRPGPAAKGVSIGMSTDEVMKALNGKPSSTVRVISQDRKIEIWTYRDSGLNIQFDKARGGGMKVTAITASN